MRVGRLHGLIVCVGQLGESWMGKQD